MEKQRWRLLMDFGNGPLWKAYFDREKQLDCTDIPVIDNDELLQKLNQEVQDMYTNLYYFDYKDQPCYFDEEEFERLMPKFKKLMKQIRERIEELNDGSFYVQDNIHEF